MRGHFDRDLKFIIRHVPSKFVNTAPCFELTSYDAN